MMIGREKQKVERDKRTPGEKDKKGKQCINRLQSICAKKLNITLGGTTKGTTTKKKLGEKKNAAKPVQEKKTR